MSSKYSRSKLLQSVGAVVLVLYGFFVAQFIVSLVFSGLVDAGVLATSSLQSASVQFIASAIAYGLALTIILGTFTAISDSTKGLPKILGIDKQPTLSFFYYVLVGYGVYFLLSFLLIMLAQFIPGFDTDQEQAVGFEQLGSQVEYIMAATALVILAPIIEEAIFRGFLFSRLRQNINFWWTTLIVSIVFGLVHMQWNVGVDVFALSVVLCFIREKTGSIWAAVGVHMVKNALAFTILFLQFDIEKVILQLLY